MSSSHPHAHVVVALRDSAVARGLCSALRNAGRPYIHLDCDGPIEQLQQEHIACVVTDGHTVRGPSPAPGLTAHCRGAPIIALLDSDVDMLEARSRLGVDQVYPADGPLSGLLAATDAWSACRARRDNLNEPQGETRDRTTLEYPLLDCLSAIVILVGNDGRIEYLNPPAQHAFGLPAHPARTATLASSPIQWLTATTAPELERARTGTTACRIDDVEFRDSAGRTRLLGLTLSPLGHGRALVMARDITERKREEALYLQGRKLEAVGQLAAGVAHEINTPIQFLGDNIRFLGKCVSQALGLVNAYDALFERSEIARHDPDLQGQLQRARRRARLDFLESQAPPSVAESIAGLDSIAAIVKALKGFSQADAQGAAAVDANQALRDIALVSKASWQPVAELKLELSDKLPTVIGFAGELKQALLHLVTNAVQALAEKQARLGANALGSIELRTRGGDDGLQIEVTDDADGVPLEIQDRIFDPFFTTKAVGSGSGQGLTIARSIIEDRHGGSLRVESARGGGTTFRVHIPSDPKADVNTARGGIGA